MANSADLEQTPHYAVSDLGLYYLLRHVLEILLLLNNSCQFRSGKVSRSKCHLLKAAGDIGMIQDNFNDESQ